MRLVVVRDGQLYRLAVDDGGARRSLLMPGETPSWAGGWAGKDGAGGYDIDGAVEVLRQFGLSAADAQTAVERASLGWRCT